MLDRFHSTRDLLGRKGLTWFVLCQSVAPPDWAKVFPRLLDAQDLARLVVRSFAPNR